MTINLNLLRKRIDQIGTSIFGSSSIATICHHLIVKSVKRQKFKVVYKMA
jgi:hypothetical protein